MHRDPRKDAAYFAERNAYRARTNDEFRELVQTGGRTDLLHAIYRSELHQLIGAYSAGAAVDELRDRYARTIETLGAFQRVHGFDAHRFGSFDAYVHALWLVALAILLDVPDAGLKAAVIQIRNGAQDVIFDRLLALRLPDRATTTKLLYPRPYKPLLAALDATPEARPPLIAKFLKGYLAGMTGAYWSGNHASDDAGYFGYWCFELAAFVKLGGIDDTSFRDHELYPRDLVVARSRV